MRFALIAVAVLAVSGCKGSCRRLAEKLCDCSLNSVDKDTCLRTASAAESSNPPQPADEMNCSALYDNCDCRLIDTPEGKVRCGLARPPLNGSPGDAGASDGGP